MKVDSPPKRDMEVREKCHLTREREFPSSADLSYVIKLLRDAHSTGTLMIDISQGGVGSIRFREESSVDFT